jgi:hypothetical protein
MKNRWSNAAPFVSLLDGWPEYDYPAYAVACVSKSFARGSAASRLPCSCSPAMPATAKHGEQKTAGRTRLHSLASVTAGPGFLPRSALLRLHTPRRRCQPLSLCPLSPATPATVEHDPAEMKKTLAEGGSIREPRPRLARVRLPGIRCCRVCFVLPVSSAASHLPRPRPPAAPRARFRATA